MRLIMTVLILCSLSGCATMHDPNFWAAMAGGAGDGVRANEAALRAQQEQTNRVLQQSIATAPVTCTSTEYSPGTVTTRCQ
jgi:hypothetical protein